MATGSYDANGIWNYGEDDNIALFSDTLNMLAESTSDAFTDDRSRLSTLEAGSLSGLIPVKPTTVTVGTGTASVNDLGVVTFTGATSIQLNGVFSTAYANYRIIFQSANTTDNSNNFLRMVTGGTSESSNNYRIAGRYYDMGASTNTAYSSSAANYCVISIGNGGGTSPQNNTVLDILLPFAAAKTGFTYSGMGTFSASFFFHGGGNLNTTTSYDGLVVYPSGGNMTGKVQVFGYND